MDRRTLLKGAGIALALPQLESFGEVPKKAPRRMLTIVNHLSFYQPALIPQKDGSFCNPPELLQELSPHFDNLKVYSQLDNPGVEIGLGHTPCVGVLSGYFNTLQRKNRISIDQAIADHIGNETRFRSLVFQAGENLNFSQIAWDKHGLPVRQIDSPKKIFDLLFGVDGSEARQKQILAEDRSILDVVYGQAKSMEKKLNQRDREKMDEYLTSVREVEKTVQRQHFWSGHPKPETQYELQEFSRLSVDAYFKVMLDLAVLALETDSSRSVTIQIPFWDSFKHEDVSGNYHHLSHHGKKPETIKKLLKVEHGILKRISETLSHMKASKPGEPSLFDQTTTMVTSAMGSANAHTFNNLPAMIIDSRIQNPGHWAQGHRPMCDLYLSLLQHFCVERNGFGESHGTLDFLS